MSGIEMESGLTQSCVVLSTLLYACETWTVYQGHAKRLNHFHLCCLRKLLKIKWQDNIPDTEVLKRAGMQSVHTLLKLECLMSGYQRKYSMEKCSQGGRKERYKDSLKDFNIPPKSWEQIALDRAKWRCLIRKGADDYETKRICEAERKCKERKARAKGSSSVSSFSELICSICNRQFRANIGLISHQRTH